MMSTSKFPIQLGGLHEETQIQSDCAAVAGNSGTHETQTINLGYDQSQSFSAFNSKHILSSNHINQTPFILQKLRAKMANQSQISDNGATTDNNLPTESNEACNTVRVGQKKPKGLPKKRFLIKQDLLTMLLQKALEKKLS